jgi:hypothetical protein
LTWPKKRRALPQHCEYRGLDYTHVCVSADIDYFSDDGGITAHFPCRAAGIRSGTTAVLFSGEREIKMFDILSNVQ